MGKRSRTRVAALVHKSMGRVSVLDYAVPDLPPADVTTDEAVRAREWAAELRDDLACDLECLGDRVPVGLSVVVLELYVWVGFEGEQEGDTDFIEAHPLPDERLAWDVPVSASLKTPSRKET